MKDLRRALLASVQEHWFGFMPSNVPAEGLDAPLPANLRNRIATMRDDELVALEHDVSWQREEWLA
jgi:hypothetical protein